MKLFDIKVHTSDREYDITLRNLTIIRASQIIHWISIACITLIHSIKRLLIPGKVVIKPLILIKTIKSLRQKIDVAVDSSMLLRSFKRVTMDDRVHIAADSNISAMKKIRGSSTWRVAANALLGSKKPITGNATVMVDADMCIQSVRKRRLGELSLERLVDMDPMTLDELDYVVVHTC